MLHTSHYFAVLPLFAKRSRWISRITGAPIGLVSSASCIESFNLNKAADALRVTILPSPTCGYCGSTRGDFKEEQEFPMD